MNFEETPGSGAGSAVHILILDDEPCVSDLLSELLRLLGYESTKCGSPVAALELLGRTHFDVILTDFRMPQMNGDEFFQRAIAAHPELADKVVFLTGDTMNEDTLAFLRKYSARHLSKPFDFATVEQTILEIVARKNGALAA